METSAKLRPGEDTNANLRPEDPSGASQGKQFPVAPGPVAFMKVRTPKASPVGECRADLKIK